MQIINTLVVYFIKFLLILKFEFLILMTFFDRHNNSTTGLSLTKASLLQNKHISTRYNFYWKKNTWLILIHYFFTKFTTFGWRFHGTRSLNLCISFFYLIVFVSPLLLLVPNKFLENLVNTSHRQCPHHSTLTKIYIANITNVCKKK